MSADYLDPDSDLIAIAVPLKVQADAIFGATCLSPAAYVLPTRFLEAWRGDMEMQVWGKPVYFSDQDKAGLFFEVVS